MPTNDYYLPPKAPLGAGRNLNRGIIGLKVGAIYSSPLLFMSMIFILAALDPASGMRKDVWIAIPFAICGAEIAFTGKLIGSSNQNPTSLQILVSSLIHGLIWIASFMGFSVLGLWLMNHEKQTFTRGDIWGSLIGVLLCAFYAFALAKTVRWRVRVASNS